MIILNENVCQSIFAYVRWFEQFASWSACGPNASDGRFHIRVLNHVMADELAVLVFYRRDVTCPCMH